MYFCLKTRIASKKVKMGVKLLRTPATALGICVCPTAYKIAGNPLPHNPIIHKALIFSLGISFHLLMSNGRNAKKEIPILAEATSYAV
jgi:hypothetical protein